MSALRIMGPACMAVCISSPVRSKKPVLMKATRLAAAAIHAFRFTDVRRSSSIMPSFTVLSGRPSSFSTWVNNSAANATSEGPCILGFTMYTEPLRLLRMPFAPLPFRSCRAMVVVTTASRIPSGISLLSPHKMAGLVIKWPTLRKNNMLRPCMVTFPPFTPV